MEEHILPVQTEDGEYRLLGRTCEISAYSFVPKKPLQPPERTYFGSPKKTDTSHNTYDRLFHPVLDYNNKLHRDDREHAKSRGLTVNDEEHVKPVPSLASSEYGHRIHRVVEERDRKHARIALVNSEFYRRNTVLQKGE